MPLFNCEPYHIRLLMFQDAGFESPAIKKDDTKNIVLSFHSSKDIIRTIIPAGSQKESKEHVKTREISEHWNQHIGSAGRKARLQRKAAVENDPAGTEPAGGAGYYLF
jgi:hypothetical protein